MEVKQLKYDELIGISKKEISEHYKLYEGYVGKVNEIRQKLRHTDMGAANATYSEFRELKLEEGFALDATILHELYFENLGGTAGPSENMKNIINQNFDSIDNFKDELFACGISARGWVVLALDEEENLRFFICDSHNQGGIWDSAPIMVLDVYEHAYCVDYTTNRKGYLEAFWQNIDWRIVENRV